jgi:hypothetical protein
MYWGARSDDDGDAMESVLDKGGKIAYEKFLKRWAVTSVATNVRFGERIGLPPQGGVNATACCRLA